MECCVCVGRLGAVRLDGCGHVLCRPCWLSAPTCLVANCYSLCSAATDIDNVQEDKTLVRCVECNDRLLIAETGMSLPCPHSVWLCTNPVPEGLVGTPSMYPAHSGHGEKRRASNDDSAPDIQLFRTPALVAGTDTYCNVHAHTRVLWNPQLSIEILSDTRVRVVHCIRNMVVRLNTQTYTLMRGTFHATYVLAERLRSMVIMALASSVFKPGPCRLLIESESTPSILFTESFQFFTYPPLNPVLRSDVARGMLMGVELAVSGIPLRDLMVGQGIIQCARCRRAWPVRDKFDPILQTLIDTCGSPGLAVGHLQAVVDRANSIADHQVPAPRPQNAELCLANMWPEACESRRFLERWRQLPVGGERALDELPDICMVVNDVGLLVEGFASNLPLVNPRQQQLLLIELRILDYWQPIPHASYIQFRHRLTHACLYSRTPHTLLFFNR